MSNIPVLDFRLFFEYFEYDPLTGIITNKKSRVNAPKGIESGGFMTNGYRTLAFNGKSYLTHRVAWLLMTGCWPKNEIDHANSIRSDNRFCNLREATKFQNRGNQKLRSDSKTGLKGVKKAGKKYSSRITVNKKTIHLGQFDSPEQAYEAYKNAAERYFSEFAKHKNEHY